MREEERRERARESFANKNRGTGYFDSEKDLEERDEFIDYRFSSNCRRITNARLMRNDEERV